MKVGIIDIGIGNLASVKNAVLKIGMKPNLCNDAELLSTFDAVILPGVGAFPAAMKSIQETQFDCAIYDYLKTGKVLVGICLGMQLLLSESDEIKKTKGLDLISGQVETLRGITKYAIPHIGWNNIETDIEDFKKYEGDYYFVHSYYCNLKNDKNLLFKCNYENDFPAAIYSDTIYGLQFHPEKSQNLGLNLLSKCLRSC